MSKVYDVFADKYIDIIDIDPIAPPERYKEITQDLLCKNAARWIEEALLRHSPNCGADMREAERREE